MSTPDLTLEQADLEERIYQGLRRSCDADLRKMAKLLASKPYRHLLGPTEFQVRDIAHLARLELTENELEAMARQLGAIVDYVAQLQQVPTDGVEPLAHALPVSNVFRDDVPAASLSVEEALANAPERWRDGRGEQFYSVPAVLE